MRELESRRSSRTAGSFWVAVEGIDAGVVQRRGDLSATGMFFEVDAPIGDVGTIQWLHVESHDRTQAVDVMAHVVRQVSMVGVDSSVRGVALEFLPESNKDADNLCHFALSAPEPPRASAIAGAQRSQPGHLTGLLSRITFTALCSLLELERITGELRIRRDGDVVTLFVKGGRFVDVVSSRGREARAVLSSLLDCRHGSFALVVGPVEREDRLGLSMTRLLLDLARELDESKRAKAPSQSPRRDV